MQVMSAAVEAIVDAEDIKEGRRVSRNPPIFIHTCTEETRVKLYLHSNTVIIFRNESSVLLRPSSSVTRQQQQQWRSSSCADVVVVVVAGGCIFGQFCR